MQPRFHNIVQQVHTVPAGISVFKGCFKTALRIEALEKAKGLFGLSVHSKVSYSGNSLMLRIPQKLAKLLGLAKGKDVVMYPEGKEKMVIELA